MAERTQTESTFFKYNSFLGLAKESYVDLLRGNQFTDILLLGNLTQASLPDLVSLKQNLFRPDAQIDISGFEGEVDKMPGFRTIGLERAPLSLPFFFMLPLDDSSRDLVISHLLMDDFLEGINIKYAKDFPRSSFLRESSRVLKKGGRLVMLSFVADKDWNDPEKATGKLHEVIDSMEAAGFGGVRFAPMKIEGRLQDNYFVFTGNKK